MIQGIADQFAKMRANPDAPERPKDFGINVSIKYCTANVLTLMPGYFQKEAKKAHPNREPLANPREIFLIQQFAEQCVNISGLQETRARHECPGMYKGWFRLSSAAKEGRGGVALWVNLEIPFGHDCLGNPHFFESDHFKVIQAEPELLVVRAKNAHYKSIIVVAHAPVQQQDQEPYRMYWDRIVQCTNNYDASWDIVLLADANATLGDHVTPEQHGVIGSHQGQPTSPSGVAFSEVVQRLGLCLPSTFEGLHQGTPYTLTSPKLTQHRIDYVAVPRSYLHYAQMQSSVEMQIDLQINRPDHQAVTLQCQYTSVPNRCEDKPRQALPYRRPIPACSDDVQVWRKALRAVPASVPCAESCFTQNVHQHAFTIEQGMKEQATHSLPKQKSKVRPYLSQIAIDLLHEKRRIQRGTNRSFLQERYLYIVCCFQAWKDVTTPSPASCAIKQIHHRIAIQMKQLKQVRQALHQAMQTCRAEYAERIAANARDAERHGGMNDLWKEMRPLLPKSKQMKNRKAMPIAAVSDQALEYFAEIESGKVVQPEELVQQCQTSQDLLTTSGPIALDALYTKVHLETAMARVKSGKAPNEDLLVSELFSIANVEAAHLWFPLMLKASIYAHQPLTFRGGTLVSLWKSKQPNNQITSYRSVLLSTTASKCHQAIQRHQLMQQIGHRMPVAQLGGKQGSQPCFASHAVRTFLQIGNIKHKWCAVLFLDVKSHKRSCCRITSHKRSACLAARDPRPVRA